MYLCALTFLGELDVGLFPSVAVLHIAGIVAEIALLQRVDGQGDGNLLLPQVLPDCPTRGGREHGKVDSHGCCWPVFIQQLRLTNIPD